MNQSPTRPLREGSLFTGTNGIGLALEMMGLDVALEWVCDPDPGATALLDYHYPDVKNLGDITEAFPFDPEIGPLGPGLAEHFNPAPPIDFLTGGFPCQDISNAGKREGITGARSSLWKHYVRAIRVLRPHYVFVENVAVLRTRGLDVVLQDLARLGFDAEWCSLRASDVGAPHQRNRFFLVAADATRERLDWTWHLRPSGRDEHSDGSLVTAVWGRYTPAVERWERITGRPAPVPTVPGARSSGVLNPALCEWMMGFPTGWITDVPGLTRNQQLKLAGNGVVPQQGAAAFTHLLGRIAA